MSKRGWVAGTVIVGVGAIVLVAVWGAGTALLARVPGMSWVSDATGMVDEPGPRPDFQLPFACGQRWQLTTYESHNPEHKKIDMYRADGTTRGSVVRASAPGEVIRLPYPGGVKIDHGGRWNTLYLHMERISVEVGDQVEQGQPIGRVGSVATSAAHLHYEQLFDGDGDGWAFTPEMKVSVIQGERYRMDAAGPFPTVESTNNCQP